MQIRPLALGPEPAVNRLPAIWATRIRAGKSGNSGRPLKRDTTTLLCQQQPLIDMLQLQKYGEMPHHRFNLPGPAMAVSSDRLDLKLSSDDKQLLIQSAAIEGMILAAFVRSAAKKQASEAILRERQL